MVYEEIESENNMWLPQKEGDQIEGVVIKKEEEQYGTQLTLEIREAEEIKEIKTPSHKVLQARIKKIEVGDKIRITYKGEEPPTVKGQNPTKIYKVERDNPEETC